MIEASDMTTIARPLPLVQKLAKSRRWILVGLLLPVACLALLLMITAVTSFAQGPPNLSQSSTNYSWSNSGAFVYTSAIRFDAGTVASFRDLILAAGTNVGKINPTLGWNCDGKADNGFSGGYLNPLSAHCLNTTTAFTSNVTQSAGITYYEVSSAVPIPLSGIVEFAWQEAGTDNWGTNTNPIPGVYFDVFTCGTLQCTSSGNISDSLPLPYFVWTGQVSQQAPTASITPPFINFPEQSVNTTSSPVTLTVANTGNAPLTISAAPTIIGFNAADFTVTGNTTCVSGALISPGSSCDIDVAFAPSTSSWETATLVLLDNAGYGVGTVPLSGGGQVFSISPNPVPGLSAPQSFTITGANFANGATINWQDLTNLGHGSLVPDTISPHSMMTASMNFTDATAIWQLEVVNQGKTTNWFPFQVNGANGGEPSFLDDYPFKSAPIDALDPYDLAYEECTSYVAWRMNRDARTTDANNPSFFQSMAGGKWGNATNWAVNATPPLGLGYVTDHEPQVGAIAQWTTACNANGKCPGGHVAYVEAVNSDGSIVVSEYNYASDDGGIEHQYGVRPISPTSGVFPQWFIHILRLSLSAPSVRFGSQATGTSTSQTITVTNSLSTAISLNVAVAPSIAGSGTTDFTESDNCAGLAMAPSSECDVTVTFAPPTTLTKGSARSASIVLNWGNGPQLIPVSGVALVSLVPSKQAISFGPTALGVTSAAKIVTLTNRTGADLTVSSVASGQDFAAAGCVGPLAQGASCTISVIFSPTATGQRTATLSITDTAINSPQTVSLTGNGILPVPVTPASVTFATRAVGSASSAKTITIKNNLPTTLAISGIGLVGAYPGDFALSANTCGPTLPAGANCTVDVAFIPTAKGSRTAAFDISDSVGTQSASLAGTGK